MKLLNEETKQFEEFNSHILAIDYDGTIDYAGFPKVGNADMNTIKALKEWKAAGNKLILWTCRDGSSLADAVRYMNDLGIDFDAVNDNIPEIKRLGFRSPKIFAHHYIDDAANAGFSSKEKVSAMIYFFLEMGI